MWYSGQVWDPLSLEYKQILSSFQLVNGSVRKSVGKAKGPNSHKYKVQRLRTASPKKLLTSPGQLPRSTYKVLNPKTGCLKYRMSYQL